MLSKGTSFHDSSLVSISHRENDTLLFFENVYVDGTLRFAELVLKEVVEVVCDGARIAKIEMIYDDGEILELSVSDKELSMLVIWTEFKKHIDETRSYQISCTSVVANIGSVSPDNPVAN